jgi:hypothetical protein
VAILLDFGATANMTLGQRAIFSLGAELRGRLNGLYVAAFFIGCARHQKYAPDWKPDARRRVEAGRRLA